MQGRNRKLAGLAPTLHIHDSLEMSGNEREGVRCATLPCDVCPTSHLVTGLVTTQRHRDRSEEGDVGAKAMSPAFGLHGGSVCRLLPFCLP